MDTQRIRWGYAANILNPVVMGTAGSVQEVAGPAQPVLVLEV